MKSTQLPDLPFGISRNGAYTHPPSKLAWVVVGGVAYAESFEQAQYEFKNLRYESVGWDNYQSLRKLWLKMRAGPDRNAIGSILSREEQYWNTQRLRRSSSLYWLRADSSSAVRKYEENQ